MVTFRLHRVRTLITINPLSKSLRANSAQVRGRHLVAEWDEVRGAVVIGRLPAENCSRPGSGFVPARRERTSRLR